jgi:hypothetical protein
MRYIVTVIVLNSIFDADYVVEAEVAFGSGCIINLAFVLWIFCGRKRKVDFFSYSGFLILMK